MTDRCNGLVRGSEVITSQTEFRSAVRKGSESQTGEHRLTFTTTWIGQAPNLKDYHNSCPHKHRQRKKKKQDTTTAWAVV